MKKLSELVSSALSEAQTKIASAASAEPSKSPATAPTSTNVPVTASAKTASVIDTAKEGIKLAESLEHIARLWPKLASASKSTMSVSGPEILTSPDKGQTKDTPTKATTVSHDAASHGGGGGNAKGQVANDGSVGGVPNPYSKQAAEELLLAKIAQSNALIAVGQAKEAAALANNARAEYERAKRAYEEEDGSTKTPKGSPKSLETQPSVPSGVAKDNAGMISMTKRDAKKREVAEIAQHLRERAFSSSSDKGLSDNLDHTQGAKIAAKFAAVAARKSGRAA